MFSTHVIHGRFVGSILVFKWQENISLFRPRLFSEKYFFFKKMISLESELSSDVW